MSVVLFFHDLSFGYASAAGLLFEHLNAVFLPGWTGIAGFNGCGKSTLLKLAAGELTPETGQVGRNGSTCFCCQECDVLPPELTELLAATDLRACEIRCRFGLEAGWDERWESLSFGERKRAQLGCAFYVEPDILCLDEPTNHLDRDSVQMLKAAMREFYGIGLLVSHDRELLDAFCGQCLFISEEGATLRPGNWTEGRSQQEIELQNRSRIREQEKAELRRMKQELLRRRRKAEKAEGRNSKRKLDRHDHDGKGRIDAARVSGRSRAATDLVRQQRVKVERQDRRLSGMAAVKLREYDFKIPYGSRSGRNRLFALPAGELMLGEGRPLAYPELRMETDDRIGITGGNGLGKSTLIRHILPKLTLEPERVLYLPQEIPESEREELQARLAALKPAEQGKVMQIIHNLGSLPELVLSSARLSPGELRKLRLALGVNEDIQLLVMDEPTNHLDLPSVECLENALADAECALLLVSHDWRFLRRLTRKRWDIRDGILKTGYWE